MAISGERGQRAVKWLLEPVNPRRKVTVGLSRGLLPHAAGGKGMGVRLRRGGGSIIASVFVFVCLFVVVVFVCFCSGFVLFCTVFVVVVVVFVLLFWGGRVCVCVCV